MKKVEQKITEGLVQPRSLIESCEVLGMCKVRALTLYFLNVSILFARLSKTSVRPSCRCWRRLLPQPRR